MKTCGRMEVCFHAFLTLALYGGEWSASRPRMLYRRGKGPGTPYIGGWVGPRTDLDEVAKREKSLHCPYR